MKGEVKSICISTCHQVFVSTIEEIGILGYSTLLAILVWTAVGVRRPRASRHTRLRTWISVRQRDQPSEQSPTKVTPAMLELSNWPSCDSGGVLLALALQGLGKRRRRMPFESSTHLESALDEHDIGCVALCPWRQALWRFPIS
jgi:hypothetical protein